MRKYIIALTALTLCSTSFAQNQSEVTEEGSGYQMKPNSDEVEINILSTYYDQDGNHSPVTGGEGTEKLNDISNVIIINVPLDKSNSIGIYGGADAYSSASTDNIDTNVSSASSKDVRTYGTLSYNHKNLKKGEIYGLRAGFSKEYDYRSFSVGFNTSKEWNQGNTELNFTGQAFLDKWLGKEDRSNPIELIYPELWILPYIYENQFLTTSNRNSFNAQIYLSQVLNKRMQISLSAEAIYMKGLLSTPFHTVYFADQPEMLFDIERLPDSRLKIPLGLRFNWFPLDYLVIRTNYRYYFDDFGITAHSFDIETPIKLSYNFTVSPFYRYHTQTSATYFAPKNTHVSTSEFYTSDFDLSALSSHKYGVGLRFAPVYGIAKTLPLLSDEGWLGQALNPFILPSKKVKEFGSLTFKYAELRGAIYKRTTDLSSFTTYVSPTTAQLDAFNVSLNLGFTFK